jgi:DNA helicase-2/ATP-dependent DNA helicase PcrA
VRSGVRFFESAHVKDVIAHLKVIANPRDEIAWRRVLKLLPRVGDRTAEKIVRALAGRPDPLSAVARGEIDGLLPRGSGDRWRGLKEQLQDLGPEGVEARPGEMIRRVLHGDYTNHVHERFEDAEARLEDLNQLSLFALGFDGVEAFLSELALSSNLEAESAMAPGGEEEPRLVLSTIHQAKGLEWRVVFVLWLVEGRFPSARSLREEEGAEEERRLFYVAVTRARDELYLCHPRLGRDEHRQDVLLKPSRFVHDLGADVYERWQVEEPGREERRLDPTLFDDGPFLDE